MPELIAAGRFRYNGASQGSFTVRNVYPEGRWGGLTLDFGADRCAEVEQIAATAERVLTRGPRSPDGDVVVLLLDDRYLMIRGQDWVERRYEVCDEDVERITEYVAPAIEGFEVESLGFFTIPPF